MSRNEYRLLLCNQGREGKATVRHVTKVIKSVLIV